MSSNEQEFHFLSNISSIPLLIYAKNIGFNFYDNIKKYNPYLDSTLSTTEHLIVYIANTPSVQKVTQKLEKPLALMDTYACDGLQMLEQKYPSIRMAPEEFKESFNQMMVWKGMGAKKLEQVMHNICRQRRHGMEKALVLLEGLLSPRVEVYVNNIERTVDDYLPPLEDRDDYQIVAKDGSRRLLSRLAVIPMKVKSRLAQRYNHLVFNITWNDKQNKDK